MRKVFTFIALLYSISSIGQKLELAIEGAPNLTNVYSLNKDQNQGAYLDKEIRPGYTVGTSIRYNYSDKLYIKSNLFFENRNIMPGYFYLTDNNGQRIREYRTLISNNYINWSIQNFFKCSSVFSIGIGINNHFLLYSKTHFKGDLLIDQNGTIGPHSYRNYFYKPYWLSIPIIFHFDIKRVNLWLTYDKSIMSRINKNALFKEFEDCFQVGVGYKLIRK